MSECAGPLDGIRVIEVGTLISGPFAGRLLGDLGAEVIKIEPPGSPDPLRTWGQAELDGHHFFWTVHARNKKAITLNLREPKGHPIFAVSAASPAWRHGRYSGSQPGIIAPTHSTGCCTRLRRL